jgi:hypothetical protein
VQSDRLRAMKRRGAKPSAPAAGERLRATMACCFRSGGMRQLESLKLMRAVIQRVSRAQVAVDGEVIGKIAGGLLVLLGVAKTDAAADADYLAGKIAGLRIFEDENGRATRKALCLWFRNSPSTATLGAAGGRRSMRRPRPGRRGNCTSISWEGFGRAGFAARPDDSRR